MRSGEISCVLFSAKISAGHAIFSHKEWLRTAHGTLRDCAAHPLHAASAHFFRRMNPARALTALCLMLALTLPFAGCGQHCTLVKTIANCRLGSTDGQQAAKEIARAKRKPTTALGRCADLAALAEQRLRAAPDNTQAREDYNFAVARIFEILHDEKLQPWRGPVTAQGREGAWTLTFKNGTHADLDLGSQDIAPVDRYRYHSMYVRTRSLRTGIGAPLVVSGREGESAQAARLADGGLAYYGMTGLLHFDGRTCTLSVEDPLAVERVRFANRSFPLAADFSAPLAFALAQENLNLFGVQRQLAPGKYADTARIARLQPYDPTKIPVICLHGLIESPVTWVPVINALRGDEEIRRRYQFWFFSYPSGYPAPFSAAIMRRQLDEINRRHPGHKKFVLIGHSMGGLISRMMITDSGTKIWDACLPHTRGENIFSSDSQAALADALIFRHRPEVSRVIYVSTPHRGSTAASGWMGRIGTHLVKTPSILAGNPAALESTVIPNSIETLSPENPFVKALSETPMVPGVPHHSIMGDRGLGGSNDRTGRVRTDGFVPYWSSHIDSAKSELVVPSRHSAHQHEKAIAEIRRILLEHARR